MPEWFHTLTRTLERRYSQYCSASNDTHACKRMLDLACRTHFCVLSVYASVDRSFTPTFNLTGHPAASVPCGFTADGVPVGLQIVGPRHADALVLQAAAGFEAIQPWADRRPPIA